MAGELAIYMPAAQQQLWWTEVVALLANQAQCLLLLTPGKPLLTCGASNTCSKALVCGASVVPLPDYYKKPADD